MRDSHEVQYGGAVLPEVRKVASSPTVDGVGIDPLDVSQVPQGHSQQVNGVVDQRRLRLRKSFRIS